MIIFNPSRSSNISLDSINEMLKEGLKKNEEITFYSGSIIKTFLRENKNRKAFGCFSPEQETFIELIKKIFFFKKAKILNFEKFDETEFFKIKNYKGDIIGRLMYFILSYLFLKKISKSINETDILLKELIKIDRTFNYDIIEFIIKNFDKNEFNKLTDKFVLYDKNEN